LSRVENSQIEKKASGMERMPGLGKGVMGSAKPNTSTHTVLLKTTHTVAVTRPRKPPMVAPRVVQPRQAIDSTRTGKLAREAMAKARPTMKATFWFSKIMPSKIANTPSTTVEIREMRIWSFLVARPLVMTLAYNSCEIAAAPAKANPASTATIVAKVTAA